MPRLDKTNQAIINKPADELPASSNGPHMVIVTLRRDLRRITKVMIRIRGLVAVAQ